MKRDLCKQHFGQMIRNTLSTHFIKMFKSPGIAFGIFDPQGAGFISFESFTNSRALMNISITQEELKSFFHLNNIFKEGHEEGITFQKFRQLFFPHVTVSGPDPKPDP
jgi:Ca2+-binding EF-hand superfamily protein